MRNLIVDKPGDIHRRASFWISVSGALGGLGSALALAGGAAPWLGIIPEWAVFALGGFICACTLVAYYIKQKHGDGPEQQ